ncbi:MAG: Fe2+-dependent dioxygenase [Verrucomicrobiota bacterium]
MFTRIENFLQPTQLVDWVSRIENLTWEDGARTAGAGKKRKNNEQLTPATKEAVPALQLAMQHLMNHPHLKAWAEPRRIARIMFARYGEGMFYGSHNDAPITHFQALPARADISFTIFLNDPSEYEGGELVLESPLGECVAKEPAGTIVLYDTGLRHRVDPITSGTRLVAVGWIESLIRSPEAREILRDIDQALNALALADNDGEDTIALRRARANLLRMWAET